MHHGFLNNKVQSLTSSNWLGVYALAPLLKETCRSAEGSSMPSGGAAAAPAAAAATDSLPCGGVVCLRKPAAGGAGAGAFAALLLRSTPCGRLLLLGALPSC